MKKRFLLLLFLFLLVGCEEQVSENCQSTSNGRGKVLSVLPLGTIGSSYLSNFLNDNNIDIGVRPENDVKIYSIVYETIDWDGIVRQASGAIYVPDIEEN